MIILRCMSTCLVLLISLCSVPAFGNGDSLEGLVMTGSLDCVMEAAIASGLVSGGVLLVGDGKEDLFVRSYGRVSNEAGAPDMETDTVFDLASLTKVLATAPSIVKLVDGGKLDLRAPVTRWFPEFAGKGRDGILPLHLLTHTSGLPDLEPTRDITTKGVLELSSTLALSDLPGSVFIYSDINFILLGELVSRISGSGLDVFASENFYAPLGMRDTGFSPSRSLISRSAPTLDHLGRFQIGVVQDRNAHSLGGVAGHAGLFGTAADIARFCRMLLQGGELSGKRVLSEAAVRLMISPFQVDGGKVVRGLGWDIDSPYSSPRGGGFSDISFGHTGYSGTSVWIDPRADLFVILLATRLDYSQASRFNSLRAQVSTLAAELFRPRETVAEPSLPLEETGG